MLLRNSNNYLGVFYESYKVVYCKHAIVIIIPDISGFIYENY
ncbi:hypothetical protein BSPWISOX_2030 [uncultured Gammaproteobacteria bacterium]|nr:hypothetical protein BSPWISOX_2030 [uncultured Gammaproteobacteria bacterium]